MGNIESLFGPKHGMIFELPGSLCIVANAKEMLGKTLVTKQTGPEGKQVNRLYIEDGAAIEFRGRAGGAGQ